MKAPRERRDGCLSTVVNQKRGEAECGPMVRYHGLVADCVRPDAEGVSAFRRGYYVCNIRRCQERDEGGLLCLAALSFKIYIYIFKKKGPAKKGKRPSPPFVRTRCV